MGFSLVFCFLWCDAWWFVSCAAVICSVVCCCIPPLFWFCVELLAFYLYVIIGPLVIMLQFVFCICWYYWLSVCFHVM